MLEIERLDAMLKEAGIPFERANGNNFKRIKYPSNDDYNELSIIQGHYSYGGDENLLETMGEYGIIEGWLTAEQVFERIKHHYERSKGNG